MLEKWSPDAEMTNLRFKKPKARVKPMLNSKVNPNKAPIDIQKKCSSNFSPRLSRVALPTVVSDDNICE